MALDYDRINKAKAISEEVHKIDTQIKQLLLRQTELVAELQLLKLNIQK